jgi:hypothetical protein
MQIRPDALSSLASDYAKDMTSIRGRRVQRLLKREFAGADEVMVVRLEDDGARAVLGLSASGAALCATHGRGTHAAVLRWLHGSAAGIEDRFDLLKDSLPLLASTPVPVAGAVRRIAAIRAHSAPIPPPTPQETDR